MKKSGQATKGEKRETRVNDKIYIKINNIVYYILLSPFTPTRTQIEFFATLAVQNPSRRPVFVCVCERGVKSEMRDSRRGLDGLRMTSGCTLSPMHTASRALGNRWQNGSRLLVRYL